jgi:hypothetical protein
MDFPMPDPDLFQEHPRDARGGLDQIIDLVPGPAAAIELRTIALAGMELIRAKRYASSSGWNKSRHMLPSSLRGI